MEPCQPEPVNQNLQVQSQLGAGVRPRRRARPPHAAVVVADYPQPGPDEVVHLIDPAVQVVTDAVDQHQRRSPVPGDPVVDVDPVALDETAGHRASHSVSAACQNSTEARRSASTPASSCSNAGMTSSTSSTSDAPAAASVSRTRPGSMSPPSFRSGVNGQ